MFKSLDFSKSNHALTTAFGAVLVLVILVTLAGVARMYTIGQRVERAAEQEGLKSDLLGTLQTVDTQRQLVLRRLFAAPDAGDREDAYRRYRDLGATQKSALDELHKMPLADTERTAVAETMVAANAANDIRDQMVEFLMQRETAAAASLLQTQGLAAQDRFHESLYRLLDLERGISREISEQATRTLREAWWLVAVAGALVVVFGAWVAHMAWLAHMVIRQIIGSEDALYREKELAEVTLHSIGDGVITTDAEGRVEYMNPVAEQYTGWSTVEARGQPLDTVYRVVDHETGKSLPYASGAPLAEHGASGATVRLLGRREQSTPVRDSYAPIHSRNGDLVGRVVVFHDVSQIQEMAQQLTWQASHDALTGLVNRREFERVVARVLESIRTEPKQHALMYMDLDNFKTVNDTCGHAAGDELLRQLSTIMLAKMRGADTLARLGGDEFGGLLESCPIEQAVRIANGLREAVREFRFIWQDKTFGVGISIGLVPIDAESGSVSRLLATADAVCYEAKSKGRDRVHVYRPKEDKAGPEQTELHMISQINHAFELGNFRLYRQKIFAMNAEDDAPHYEVLVRMLDREGHLVSPSGFMPAAERFNLLSSIERWVISSLVEFLHRQLETGEIPREQTDFTNAFYAVNLSGASISDSSFPEFLRKLLTRFNLPRGLVCFEVTETTAISNLTKAAQLMHEVKAMGCRFALDDFGIGMSSFAYLKYLPVDYIKIDGVFIRDMATDPMDHAIVEAINSIAHILGLKTVAEFVEEETTLTRLREMGVDYAQGFFIAKPEALEKIVGEHAVLDQA